MGDPYLLPLCRAIVASYSDVPWFQNPSRTCQVYKSVVLDHPCYTFGPTRTWQEWFVDFLAPDIPNFDHPVLGPVHLGFWNDIATSIDAICADLSALGWPSYLLAGHSKGAGEAIEGHARMQLIEHPPLATRAYEPPCVGTGKLSAFLAAQDIGWTKTVNATGVDLVTQVPHWAEWCHQGVETQLRVPDSDGIAQKHEWPAVLAAVEALAS